MRRLIHYKQIDTNKVQIISLYRPYRPDILCDLIILNIR
jgi:hypothetical protein